jgi:hypothetical protein
MFFVADALLLQSRLTDGRDGRGSATALAAMEASRPQDVMTGRFLRLLLPVTVVVFVGSSSPWIAQRAPWFLFPALAVTVAGLVTLSFVNSLARFARCYSGERRLRFFPVADNAVATVFLVILPFTHLLRVIPNIRR